MIQEIAKRTDGKIWGLRGDRIDTHKGTISCSIMGVVRLYTPDEREPIYLGVMSDGIDKLVAAWENA